MGHASHTALLCTDVLLTAAFACVFACGQGLWRRLRWWRPQRRRHRAGTVSGKAPFMQELTMPVPLRAVIAHCEARWLLQDMHAALMLQDPKASQRVHEQLAIGWGSKLDAATMQTWATAICPATVCRAIHQYRSLPLPMHQVQGGQLGRGREGLGTGWASVVVTLSPTATTTGWGADSACLSQRLDAVWPEEDLSDPSTEAGDSCCEEEG
ncbi:hypothetical protein V8C86DRAFT_2945114 [Haematococcus lacustris]